MKLTRLQLPTPGKNKFKFLAFAIVVLIFGLMLGVFWLLYQVNVFFDKNTLKFNPMVEIKINAPVEIKKRELLSPISSPSATPIPTPKVSFEIDSDDDRIIAQFANADLIWKMYGQESTWGKFDGCKREGKFNGFGFRQNTHEFVCYDSFAEVVAEVDNWLAEKLPLLGTKTALCLYNQGKLNSSCGYQTRVLSLN